MLSLLEHSFLLNLGILSVATLYNRVRNGSQVALTCTSVAITLAAFVCIAAYNAVVAVKDSRWWKRLKQLKQNRLTLTVPTIEPDRESDQQEQSHGPHGHTQAELIWRKSNDSLNEDAELALIPRNASL